MADVHEEPHSLSEEVVGSLEGDDLKQLKRDLEIYRELLLPLNKVLEWEQSHYPAVLVSIITVLFAFIWYLEPSVLTTFSLLGVAACSIDFAVPTVSAWLFKQQEWTVVEDRQYEMICRRLLNAKQHLDNFKTSLTSLKKEKPKAYLLIMMGIFATLAWIGSLIDNLLLTYVLIVFLTLVPGLRKHGILQKITKSAVDAATQVVNKAKQAQQKKTN